MKLVCTETARMEAVRVQQLPYVYQRLPLNAHGNLPLSEVRFTYLTESQCMHSILFIWSVDPGTTKQPAPTDYAKVTHVSCKVRRTVVLVCLQAQFRCRALYSS